MESHCSRKTLCSSFSSKYTIHDPLAETFPATLEGRVLFGIAIAFSTFQLVTAAGLLGLPSQVVRAGHVGFLTHRAEFARRVHRLVRGLHRSPC